MNRRVGVLLAVILVGILLYLFYFGLPDNQKFGTYINYSVTNLTETGVDSELMFSNALYSYRLEDGTTKILFASLNNDLFIFNKNGSSILAENASLGSESAMVIDMAGKQTTADSFDFSVKSNDGKITVLTEELDLGSGELGCTRDGLKISIIDGNGVNLVSNKTFVWKDYSLGQLCPEKYHVSNSGKYFYVIGDAIGGGTVDTVMKYSVDEDKMVKVEVGKNSWLGSWQLDADNGWLGGVTHGYNFEPQEIVRINLFSTEITDLTEADSGIERVFISSDGNFWAPVLSDGAEGVQNCVRVLSVGEVLVADNESQCLLSGKVVDWFDNTLVVDRDGELLLYDLTTKTIISLARNTGEDFDPDNKIVEYIGTIKIEK